MYLPECIKMVITRLVINIFYMKLAPLYSAHIGLSIYAKIQLKKKKSPMVPFLIAYYPVPSGAVISSETCSL